MSCATPLPFERLVDYWAHDLGSSDNDAVEAHLFACATCTEAAGRVAAVTERIRSLVPPVVTSEMVEALRARGYRIDDNLVRPDETSQVLFSTQDFIIHHLQELELHDAEQVRVTVRVAETGEVLVDWPRAPFEREKGEVLVACQRHFASFPPNTRFVVTTVTNTGAQRVTQYLVEHAFFAS